MNDNNFYSIDRLVEFGLSMAIANQMIGVMNYSMRNMGVAGSQMNLNAPPSTIIYVVADGNRVGPLSASEFSKLVSDRRVNKDTLAWMPGMPAWRPIESIPELLKIIALTPPDLPTT